MCFSKEASITAYIVGMLFTIILFLIGDRYDKNVAIYSFVLLQIQLAEYFMWSDQGCGLINNYATWFAQLIIYLQPISILLGAYIYNTFTISARTLRILLFLESLVLIVSFGRNVVENRGKYLCSKEKNSGYLEWDFMNSDHLVGKDNMIILSFIGVVWFSAVFLPWIFLKDRTKGLLVFSMLTLSLLYSIYEIGNLNSKMDIFRQWESKWCYTAIILPTAFLLLKIFKFYK